VKDNTTGDQTGIHPGRTLFQQPGGPVARRVLHLWALLGVASLAGITLPLSGAVGTHEQARSAYDHAVGLREALDSRPERLRTRAGYEKVIRAFQAVYRTDPAFLRTPSALAAVGELYREMGSKFSNDQDYEASIKAYEFLATQYPQSSLARDALLAMGEIYNADLKRPEDARKVYQRFLEQHPQSAKAATAEQALNQIDEALAKRAAAERASRQPVEQVARPGRLLEVSGIRRWTGADYTRIVISVDDEVQFNAQRIANPDRLVFDLAGTRLSPALVGRALSNEDGLLRQVRLAQFSPTVTRVVLDVKEMDDYSVFTLPNPFRLVIDIRGNAKAPATEALNASAPPPTGATTLTRRSTANGPAWASAGSESSGFDSGLSRAAAAPVTNTSGPAFAVTSTEAGEKRRATTGVPPEVTASVADGLADASQPANTRAGASPREVPGQPSAPTEGGSRTLTRALGLKINRIVIDAGHGGHDTGTIGPSGLCEKDLVLDVAVRLKKLIEARMGSEVVMTRSDDTFIPLEERTAMANEKNADLFISIHANASRDRTARGIETYYLNFTSNPEALEVAARENATSQESVHGLQQLIEKIALSEKIEESKELAQQIQRSVYAQVAQSNGQERDRGLKKAPFIVLIGANMPSVLSEISFLTNPRDESLLKKAAYRQKIAEALYRGIARYANNLGGLKVAEGRAADLGVPHPGRLAKPSVPSNTSPAAVPDF
jgi:N-acetylmuramoyl-L-alanine amidase